MQTGVQSDGEAGVSQASGELDLGVVGPRAVGEEGPIVGLTLLARRIGLRRRQSGDAEDTARKRGS